MDATSKIIQCAKYTPQIENLELCQLMSDLAYERMERKQIELFEIHDTTNRDWNLTMLIVLFRYLGGTHNKAAAETLARRIGYNTLARECTSLVNLESLLLGTSGLVDLIKEDSYVLRMREEFEHLSAKYNIEPMELGMWKLNGMYANNHPILRLAQFAACFHRQNITMNKILECRKRRDVIKIFNTSVSDYWVDVVYRITSRKDLSNHIGTFTSDILGINFVVQTMFAYGSYTNSETLTQRALELLESIPSENNRYTQGWNSARRITKSALDSQAIIQLSREYCECSRCKECPYGRIMRRKLSAQ